MAASDLERIAHHSGGDIAISQASCGTVWRSQRPAIDTVTYDTSVPPGLHVGIGHARIKTHARGLGGFEAAGPALSIIRLGGEMEPFTTTVGRGPAFSLGLHLNLPSLDQSVDVLQEALLAVMDSHELRAATGGAPVSRALHLLAPIDPWFQGSARDLVLQARGLELLAIAATWVLEKKEEKLSSRHQRKADAARDYIEAHLAEPLTLDAIARAVGINVRTLTETFRRRFGVSIAAFLAQRRMEIAMRMLLEGASVSLAAYTVGYRPNAFSTAFRRQFGYPPSALSRARFQRGNAPDHGEETPTDEGL